MSTMTGVDINEAFAAERTADVARITDWNSTRETRARADYEAQAARFQERVARGEMTDLGGGQYRVNTGMDAGEVWTLRQTQYGELVLPQHGLDTTTGEVALYSSVPAWHGLGQVIPGGTSSIDDVLRLARLDFDVVRRPVMFRNEVDGPAIVEPDHFVTVRADTGAPLGVVGSRYVPIQNRQSFEFLQDLVASSDVVWESAGALREGRRVFVSLRLPGTVTIDAPGVNDEIVPFIVALNSHDGSSLMQVVATPWRPVCGNTERFALRDAHSRWGTRHTSGAGSRLAEARRTLGLSLAYFQAFAAEETALAQTDLAIDDFRELVRELWPMPGAPTARMVTTFQAREEQIGELWATNTARLGETAYAAERTLTEFLDWRKTVRPGKSFKGDLRAARASLALEGSDDDTKTTIHRRLMTLVRH